MSRKLIIARNNNININESIVILDKNTREQIGVLDASVFHSEVTGHYLKRDNPYIMCILEDIENDEVTYLDELKRFDYPKSYKECCDVLGLDDSIKVQLHCYQHMEGELYKNFIKLIRCRNAYWKIAGDEMRLSEPWKYDTSKDEFSYAISYQYGYIQKNEIRHKNAIFVFPTKEMRDAFYENFKDMIEQNWELL